MENTTKNLQNGQFWKLQTIIQNFFAQIMTKVSTKIYVPKFQAIRVNLCQLLLRCLILILITGMANHREYQYII